MAIMTTAKVVLVALNLVFPQGGGVQVDSKVVLMENMEHCTRVAKSLERIAPEEGYPMMKAHCQVLSKLEDKR